MSEALDLPDYDTLIQAEELSSLFESTRKKIVEDSVTIVRMNIDLYEQYNKLLLTDYKLRKLTKLSSSSTFNKNDSEDIFSELEFKLGFIGCGFIAQNIIARLVEDEVLPPTMIQVSTRQPTQSIYDEWHQKGITFVRDNEMIARTSSLVFLCTPRNQLSEVIKSLRIECKQSATTSQGLDAFRSLIAQAMTPMDQIEKNEDNDEIQQINMNTPQWNTIFISLLSATSVERLKSVLQTDLACTIQKAGSGELLSCLHSFITLNSRLAVICNKARRVVDGMERTYRLSGASPCM